jgi:hypothetical protein
MALMIIGEYLNDAYQRFLSAGGEAEKNETGKDLIRAIFGETAIAEEQPRALLVSA